MTITYPRILPLSDQRRMQECWFDLSDNTTQTISGSNLLNLTQVIDPSWKGVFKSAILAKSERPSWSAWHKSLRGGAKTFIAYDVRHAAPQAYPTAKVSGDIASGWNGTATVTALAVGGGLSLGALPTGYQFKAGDRVGLEQSGKYGYYEVLEDVTASGTTAVIVVAPFLQTSVFTTSAVCRVFRPLCQFVIDPTSWIEGGMMEDTNVEFSGIQRL